MSKTNIIFNNKNYLIDDSFLSDAKQSLHSHLSTTMNGSGAIINFGGVSYNVDSEKLSSATNDFVSHLRAIAGNDYKVVVGGVEYYIGSDNIQGAISQLNTCWKDLSTPDSVEDLQNKYEFAYFSTLRNAVNAVNNDTIDNYDADKETAIAGVYTDENDNVSVVLLKDTTETARIKITADMTFNLGGNKLTVENDYGVEVVSGNTTIDGALEGGIIEVTNGSNIRCVQVTGGSATINGGTYVSENNGGSAPCVLFNTGTLAINGAKMIGTSTGNMYGVVNSANCNTVVSDCSIEITSNSGGYGIYNRDNAVTELVDSTILVDCDGTCYGVYNRTNGSMNIINSEITSASESAKSDGLNNSGTVIASSSKFIANAHYSVDSSDNYLQNSKGISNNENGHLDLTNCYAFGTHCGLQNAGTMVIKGGIYESYGHGGIYNAGYNTTSYISDAIIRECAMPNGYTASISGNESGMYIGGTNAKNGMSVYVDNCDIYGSKQQIVMRGGDGANNNSLYISNSRINTSASTGIRIDNDTLKVYIGVGNNFTANNTTRPSSVIETDEIYIIN